MMKFYEILFAHFYYFFLRKNKNDIPGFRAIMMLSLIFICHFIPILITVFKQKLEKLHLVLYVLFFLAINSIYFLYGNRSNLILEKYDIQNRSTRIWLPIVIIIETFSFPLIWAFTEGWTTWFWQ